MHCLFQLKFLFLLVSLAYSASSYPKDPWAVQVSEASCPRGSSSSLLQHSSSVEDDALPHLKNVVHGLSYPGMHEEDESIAVRPPDLHNEAKAEPHQSARTMFQIASHAVLNQLHAARLETQSVYMVGALCSLLLAIGAMVWLCCAGKNIRQQAAGKHKPKRAALVRSESRDFTQSGMCVQDAEGKLFTYDNGELVDWKVIFATSGSVFCHRRVVHVILQVVALSLATAAVQFYFAAQMPAFDPSKFQTFIKFIRVFIAFLLGLFLNASFGRWWTSVTCFKKLLTSIKRLLYTLHAIGINEAERQKVERLGIAACYIVCEDMHSASALIVGQCRLERWEQKLKWLEERGHLTEGERAELEVNRPRTGEVGLLSQVLWTWIGEVLTRLKSEPQMTPPLYVNLLFLCHTCMGIFDELKTNLMIQVPYGYSHMLAVLVHTTNISLAVIFGLEVGSMLATTEFRGQGGWNVEVLEAAALQLFILIAQPMLYQSVLVICEANLQPYGDDLCHMPTQSYIQQMLCELQTMEEAFGNARKRAVEASSGELQVNPWYKRERNDDYVESEKEDDETDGSGGDDCDDGGGD